MSAFNANFSSFTFLSRTSGEISESQHRNILVIVCIVALPKETLPETFPGVAGGSLGSANNLGQAVVV